MIDWWCSEGTTLDSVLPPYVLGASLGESRFGAVAVRIVYVLRRQEHVHRPLAHVQLRNRRRLLLLPLLLLPLLIFVLLLPAALLLLLLDLGASRVLLAVGVVLVVVDDLVVVLDGLPNNADSSNNTNCLHGVLLLTTLNMSGLITNPDNCFSHVKVT